ncbi:plasmid replication protein RepC [Martelella mediterranea]|uniref:Replication initiation protein RepC n=1 Tax=Martelella mediterranea TaxID=293089 RepID=A0A4R3NJM2_9HYPH|nr:plasmid replication protein RepC [Martelella mediterranea]TCT29268.1 replication initiation protein RepC [Martelella mediterranea]
MEYASVTTPFGQRPMSLAMMASQTRASAIPEGARVHKWKVFHNIRTARALLGTSDRALAILNALLSFYPENELCAEDGLVVWPSNEQLMARANGISPATLRRHIAVLVECGLVIRRDSPNGKRFARKGRGGQVEQAYGFDLSPVVARAEEFEALAETVEAEKRAFKRAKERVTLLRRDIVKLIETALLEGVPGNWAAIEGLYQDIIVRLPRTPTKSILDVIGEDLELLRLEIHDALNLHINSQETSGNESHNERHIQNSNPESHIESEYGFGKNQEASGSADETDNLHSLPKRELPLKLVLDACSNWKDLAEGGEIRHWREFLHVSETARPMLGISPSAWRAACVVLGDKQAAITLAAIYQRADQINNPGGYLRSLTERAGEGQFSVWPMVMALLRARLDQTKTPERPHETALTSGHVPSEDNSGMLISSALAERMKKR